MKVSALAERLNLECLYKGNQDREVSGCYAGDLLSRVMGRAGAGFAWITIMSNVNVAAVASLADVSCIILAEDVRPDKYLTEKLGEVNIPVFTTPFTTYETAWRIHEAISI